MVCLQGNLLCDICDSSLKEREVDFEVVLNLCLFFSSDAVVYNEQMLDLHVDVSIMLCSK